MKSQLARHCAVSHGIMMRGGSPRPVMKTRTAFYLRTTPLTKVARTVCSHLLHLRHATRSPFWPINSLLIKQECHQRTLGIPMSEINKVIKRKSRLKASALTAINRLGPPNRTTPQFLLPTDPSKIPKCIKEAWPKPQKRPDGSLIYDIIPPKHVVSNSIAAPPQTNLLPASSNHTHDNTVKRHKPYEPETNGLDVGPMSKRKTNLHPANILQAGSNIPTDLYSNQGLLPPQHMLNHVHGGKTKLTAIMRGGRKHIISWENAPDDVYFRFNPKTRKVRKQLTLAELRRAARRPSKLCLKLSSDVISRLE
jgi:metastasis-associated protein MTA